MTTPTSVFFNALLSVATDGSVFVGVGQEGVIVRTEIAPPSAVQYPAGGSAVDVLQLQKPFCLIDWSDDGGYTWSNPRQVSVGSTGEYNALPRIYKLGQARNRVFRIRYKHGTKFALYGCDVDAVAGDD